MPWGSGQVEKLLTRRHRRRRRRRRHLEIQVDIQARRLFWEFSSWILTHMRDVGTLRPGFYTEFRAGSIYQSGLAWGAILENTKTNVRQSHYFENDDAQKQWNLEHKPYP